MAAQDAGPGRHRRRDHSQASARDVRAARQLTSVTQEQELGDRLAAIPGLGSVASQVHSENGVRSDLLPLIASGLDAIDASQLGTKAKRGITALFLDNLRHDASRRHNELLLMLRLAEGALPPRTDT